MVGSYRADKAKAVTTLGFVIVIGLPLVVLILALALPEHRDKQ